MTEEWPKNDQYCLKRFLALAMSGSCAVLWRNVKKINELEPGIQALTDSELQGENRRI